MVEHNEAPQPVAVALVLVEEVLSPNEDTELDVSDVEDLFDDLSEVIARQRSEVRQHKDKRSKKS